MTAVVVTHAVGSIETWLKGGANRKEVFAKFCSSYRIFRHPDDARDKKHLENRFRSIAMASLI